MRLIPTILVQRKIEAYVLMNKKFLILRFKHYNKLIFYKFNNNIVKKELIKLN